MAQDKSQQTEKATPRRLEKAREEGQFPVSREFVGAVQLTAFVALLHNYGGEWWSAFAQAAGQFLAQAFTAELTPRSLVAMGLFLGTRALVPLAVGGAVLTACALALHLATTGLGWSLKKLNPDFKRFNPLPKLSDLPAQNGWAFVQAAAMLVIFAAILYRMAAANLETFFQLPFLGVARGLAQVFASLGSMLWKLTMVVMIFGCVDLFRQQRRFAQSMRMSKQDIRDEHKESEGNPHVKARLRRLQRDLRRRRMMQDLPRATAVIVNPTHFAVAIRYEPSSMAAPVVIAKGKNLIALRIRRRCTELQIPIVENQPLAQALYKAVNIGQEIPPQLYRAVAEILAYIQRLSRARWN